MFFSVIKLSPHVFHQPQSATAWAKRLSPWGIHQWVWELYSDTPSRKRDFLFRYEEDGARLYTLSQRPPVDKSGDCLIQTKPFTPQLQVGQRFQFSLRANPTVKRSPSNREPSKRHDVLMDAKFQARKQEKVMVNPQLSLAQIHEVAVNWLVARGQTHGFDIQPQELSVLSTKRMEILRQGQVSQHQPIYISTVDYTGILTVHDLDSFKQTLFHGLGPAKGFGCGLLLLKRV